MNWFVSNAELSSVTSLFKLEMCTYFTFNQPLLKSNKMHLGGIKIYWFFLAAHHHDGHDWNVQGRRAPEFLFLKSE